MTPIQKQHYENIGIQIDEVDMVELHLPEDIYSLTFLTFIKSKKKLSPTQKKDFVLKCALTFIIQMCLSLLIFVDSDG